MFKNLIYTSVVGLAFFLTSCRHDTDLSNLKAVSFISDVQPIIAGNCSQSGCHTGNVAGQDRSQFALITYDDIIKGGISPGNAHSSKIYQTISNKLFAKVMPPKPLPMLSDDQVKLIYLWIEQGAKNN